MRERRESEEGVKSVLKLGNHFEGMSLGDLGWKGGFQFETS